MFALNGVSIQHNLAIHLRHGYRVLGHSWLALSNSWEWAWCCTTRHFPAHTSTKATRHRALITLKLLLDFSFLLWHELFELSHLNITPLLFQFDSLLDFFDFQIFLLKHFFLILDSARVLADLWGQVTNLHFALMHHLLYMLCLFGSLFRIVILGSQCGISFLILCTLLS